MSLASELKAEDMHNIVDKNVTELIHWLIKLRNNFFANKDNISDELRKRVFHAGKLHKMWQYRLEMMKQADAREKARKEYKKKLEATTGASGLQKVGNNNDNYAKDTVENDDDDAKTEESVSDIEYEEEHMDKIEHTLERCRVESKVLKSLRGFKIEENPQYVTCK